MPYEPKFKYDSNGPRVTVAVRLEPGDIALLDGLVRSGYAGEIDRGRSTYYIRKSRGAAIRQAIRDAAREKRVSPSSLPGKRPSRSGWKGKVLSAIEDHPGLDAGQVAEHFELATTDSIVKHLVSLEEEGWVEKLGETFVPLHPKTPRTD